MLLLFIDEKSWGKIGQVIYSASKGRVNFQTPVVSDICPFSLYPILPPLYWGVCVMLI